jgi:zinc/manganese transport system substrate-binding protein
MPTKAKRKFLSKRKFLAISKKAREFPGMRTFWISAWMGLLGCGLAAAGPLRVTALHPLLADLAQQVGGDRVQILDMVGEGGNPHLYEPRPADLKKMQSSSLILAGGKNLEPYLDRLKAALVTVPVAEVGRTIPSLTVGKDAVYTCCPQHAHSTLDPHWWHGIDNMRRAARVVAKEFTLLDPAGKSSYESNAAAYGAQLADLKKWARAELAKVPRGQRKLVTAHNAFGYFAKEFGFEVIAIDGLTHEQNTTPQDRARTIESVRKSGVRAVFPEQGSARKPLEAIAAATGTRIGRPLIADGNGTGANAGFVGMIRHNVAAITEALAGS